MFIHSSVWAVNFCFAWKLLIININDSVHCHNDTILWKNTFVCLCSSLSTDSIWYHYLVGKRVGQPIHSFTDKTVSSDFSLSVYLSVCLSNSLSVCLAAFLSACLPVSISLCLSSVCQSVCRSVCLSVCLSVSLSVCLLQSVFLSIYPTICPS